MKSEPGLWDMRRRLDTPESSSLGRHRSHLVHRRHDIPSTIHCRVLHLIAYSFRAICITSPTPSRCHFCNGRGTATDDDSVTVTGRSYGVPETPGPTGPTLFVNFERAASSKQPANSDRAFRPGALCFGPWSYSSSSSATTHSSPQRSTPDASTAQSRVDDWA